ncbi:MAG: hypothetical protein MRJ96_15135 [Nitrospirales bacterium]|nr:hypothetical protein [Nitrospira sp.]MDR4502776.1 hypothetical protein [Nitrospirales bacterium]
MSQPSLHPPSWQHVRTYLLEHVSGWLPGSVDESLTMQLDDEDWLLEITPDGKLVCQAGYMLEDMQSILSDGTAEDLGSDELAKQAKFYLQQTVSKYRKRLQVAGFSERTEMNDEYVAMMFERPVDFEDLSSLEITIQQYRSQFSNSRT